MRELVGLRGGAIAAAPFETGAAWVQAEESGGARPPGARARQIQAGDETYVISHAHWSRIFPDAAAASGDEPAPAPRKSPALLLIGAAAALAAAGTLIWWLMLARGPNAPPPRPAPAPVMAAPVARTMGLAPKAPETPPAPPQAQASPAASSVIPAGRPHHRAAVPPLDDRDGPTEAHEAPAAIPDATPAAPPPAAKKGNAVSRFLGHLFGGHHTSANATSSGGETSAPSP